MNIDSIAVILLAACMVLICAMSVFYRLENNLEGFVRYDRRSWAQLEQLIEAFTYVIGLNTTKQKKMIKFMRFLLIVIVMCAARLFYKYG